MGSETEAGTGARFSCAAANVAFAAAAAWFTAVVIAVVDIAVYPF